MNLELAATDRTGTPSFPREQHVAVVDGYTTGAHLPAQFARLGMNAVHVQSTPEPLPRLRAPRWHEYTRCLRHSGSPQSLDELVEALRSADVRAVIAGQEPGVHLADQLGAALGLAHNDPATSRLRRDKYAMIEALRAANLTCATQRLVDTPAEATAVVDDGWDYPVVVKPLSSASTDLVTICTTAEQVHDAASRVLSSSDLFGANNRHALLQSHLDGQEYIVDTVTARGSTFVCGIWEYRKRLTRAGAPVYERDTLLDPRSDVAITLADYVRDVLPVLGVEQGAAHAEVIVTDAGPALVELGARLNGNLLPRFHDTATGNNQAFLAALAYYEPARFAHGFGGRTYRRRQPAIVHHCVNERAGVVRRIDDAVLNRLRDLDAVSEVDVKVPVGGRLAPTEDLLSSPLRVFLTAPGADEIEAAVDRVRRLEVDLFELDGPGVPAS